jgi:hypothetical protein
VLVCIGLTRLGGELLGKSVRESNATLLVKTRTWFDGHEHFNAEHKNTPISYQTTRLTQIMVKTGRLISGYWKVTVRWQRCFSQAKGHWLRLTKIILF